jgi:hypothetical protein
MRVPFTSISSRLKRPVSRITRMISMWPGYRSVFSFMKGTARVVVRLRRPSVLKASSVPTPSKSMSSGSESAGLTTTRPCSTSLAGLTYSSMTSLGANPAL